MGIRRNILLFTPDLTPIGVENGRDSTGFSLMVDEYARMLVHSGRVVDVSCSSLRNSDIKINNEYLLLRRNLWQIVSSARWRDWKYAFLYFLRARNLSLTAKLQILKQRLSTGLYYKQIRKQGSTVAFLQSFLPHIMPFVGASLRAKLPMVIVCHSGYEDESPKFRNYESSFARYVVCPMAINGICISGVSSGIVRYFQRYVPSRFYSELHVIGNPLPKRVEDLNRTKKSNAFTIIVSGTIGERKNQGQVLRALALLPKKERERLRVIFIGSDTTGGRIQKEGKALGVNAFCCFMGKLSREKALEITAEANLVVSAARNEGFGMPFIEGYSFGIPAVFFADIDAAEDLGDCKCAVMVKERSDKAFAEGILTAMHTEWDRHYIYQFVIKKFNQQVIAEKYAELLDTVQISSLSENRWDKMMLVYLRNKNRRFYQY